MRIVGRHRRLWAPTLHVLALLGYLLATLAFTWPLAQNFTTAIPGDGQNDVKVRWHYGNARWAWWWELDNASVTACAQNQPTAIGLTSVAANPAAPLAALPWAIPAACIA